MELTDLEICKRIAEIESQNVIEEHDALWQPDYEEGLKTGYDEYKEYNPLQDDALCFQLMVKYGVELTPMFSGCWCATVAKVYTFDEQIDYKLCPTWLDESPNKAICLAIIEANKDK